MISENDSISVQHKIPGSDNKSILPKWLDQAFLCIVLCSKIHVFMIFTKICKAIFDETWQKMIRMMNCKIIIKVFGKRFSYMLTDGLLMFFEFEKQNRNQIIHDRVLISSECFRLWIHSEKIHNEQTYWSCWVMFNVDALTSCWASMNGWDDKDIKCKRKSERKNLNKVINLININH